jgi:tRNA G37 N-methylase Trm5
MRVFSKLNKLLIWPLYYTIHKNIFLGFLYKKIINKFYYKGLTFNLDITQIPIENYSSFLFKTYEFNDRKIIENNLTSNNKCIVLGGGIGFIPALAFKHSKNKIAVFEINEDIIENLKKNLVQNHIEFDLYKGNLKFNNDKTKYKIFNFGKDFLGSSSKRKNLYEKEVICISSSKVDNFDIFNTLIMDIEGDEEYYLLQIEKFKNIKHIFFELHHNHISENNIQKIFRSLSNNSYILKDKFLNSFYFAKE